MNAYLLTEEDALTLRAMAEEYRRSATAQLARVVQEDQSKAPDFFVARAPAGGIPALAPYGFGDTTGTGTGTGAGRFIAGYAECEIYSVVDETTGELQLHPTLTERVYNVGPAIDEDTWVTVQRDRWGIWFASAATGNGNPASCTLTFVTGICEVSTGTGS